MLLIAVDEGGCHYKAIDLGKLSPQYKAGTLVDAAHNSISMIFKKLRWHKGKGKIITITEVDDYVEPRTGQDEQSSSETSDEVERRPEIRLASNQDGIQTFEVAHRPRNKSV